MLGNPEQSSTGLFGYRVEKKFISRKNEVFLVKRGKPGLEEYLVYKKYYRLDRMHQEIKMLRLLNDRGVPVPQIRGIGEDYILLEYLEGSLLLDFFCSLEDIYGSESTSLIKPTRQFLSPLCHWFKTFHNALPETSGRRLIMGDVNFRNFIILREKVYGLDLEECREGTIEEEIGSLCAFALTYKPSFTVWKMAIVGELMRVFINEFNLNPEHTRKELKRQLFFLGGIRGTVKEMEEFLEKNIVGKHFKL